MSGKAGYVRKEGGNFFTWKNRYLVIEKDKLSYYSKDNMKYKKGEILIRTIKEVDSMSQYKGRRFIIQIVTTTGRIYFVQCSDSENVEAWINAINEVVGRAKSLSKDENKSSSHEDNENTHKTSHPSDIPEQRLQNTNEPTPLEANSTPKIGVNDFEELKVIGRGGFGRVLLVKKKDNGKVYAMKILTKFVISSRGEIEHTRTEKNVLSKLKHPFLVNLHWSFQNSENLYIIMDFINGGELFHHLSIEKCFNEERTKFYSAQIIAGIGYLHTNGVIYRDLKPENLLLSAQGNIVITDFGLSKEGLHTNESRTSTFCGTPEYLAPEIIRGDDYTKAIDWWSVGTLIYEMLTGLPPFYSKDEENMYHNIMTANLVIPSIFSLEASDIIQKFLVRDPETRLQDESDIRAHPWFNNIDWDKLLNLELEPPFLPSVMSADDVRNIDNEFLEEDINNDIDHGPSAPVRKDAFQGFTFVEDQ